MRRLLFAGLLVGCATASTEQPNTGTDGSTTDGKLADAGLDAPMPDASIMTTLSQLVSTTNVTGNSVVCNSGENSWYRVFALADHNITGAFDVQSVTFGVQQAAGSPTVNVKIGTYGAAPGTTLDTAMITPINTTSQTIQSFTDPGANVTVPITGKVPAGARLIVEIHKTGTNTAGLHFVIGASNAGETKTGYIRAPTCNDPNNNPITQPITPAAAGRPTAQLNIVVTGTH